MRTTRQTNKMKKKRRFHLRPGAVIIAALMLSGLGSSAWQLWQLHASVEQQVTQLTQQKEALLQQQKSLNQEITELNTPSYIEQLAREQLGLVKHGEILISPKN